jgi:hypothetical protein
MNSLQEKKILVHMKQRLGEEVPQSLLNEINEEEAAIVAAEQKQLALQEERKSAFKGIFADLSLQLGQLMAEEKKKTEEEQALLDRFANVLEHVDQIKSQIAERKEQTTEEFIEDIIPQEILETTSIVLAPEEPPKRPPIKDPIKDVVDKIKATKPSSMFIQPDPVPVSRDIKDIQSKLKMLEGWVSKISMTGPGGGAGSVDQLDHRTHVVVSDSYNISRHDYYVGIDYPGNVAVYLPTTVSNGRVLVIKDESGSAAHYPITVVGRVDNDPDGFILKINNGAVQLIYSNGWRII